MTVLNLKPRKPLLINTLKNTFLYRKIKDNLSEITISFIIWLFILSGPVFITSEHTVVLSDHFLIDWLRMFPVFILFIINTLWLVPRYLFRKKTRHYIVWAFSLSVLFTLTTEFSFSYFLHKSFSAQEAFRSGHQPFEREFNREQHFGVQQGQPHDLNRPQPKGEEPEQMPPSGAELHKPIQQPVPAPGVNSFPSDFKPPFHHESFRDRHKQIFGMGFFNQIVLCFLILSLNTAIKVTLKWYKDEHSRREKEKEYLQAELTFLQNQISPHFFMNTLNNIHALIDINGQTAQQSIVRLSKMMRYLLYESAQGNTTLKKELEFLESYIDLMKLRVDETIRITFSVPDNYPNVKLPPLLLIPFIENAFKHGISYQQKSFIDINIALKDKLLIFGCSNSKFPRTFQPDPNSGIGLKNVHKRLDLLYGQNYTLAIDDSNNEFRIKLSIPVYED